MEKPINISAKVSGSTTDLFDGGGGSGRIQSEFVSHNMDSPFACSNSGPLASS